MTDVSEGQWRWPLPDDWTPTGTWCVQITIPADQQYFDRLTGALGLLTLQKSWMPDPTGAGPAAVAQAWEQALYLNLFSVNTDCFTVPSPPIPNDAAADDAAAAIYTVFFQHIVSELNTLAPTSGDCPDAVDTVMAELTPYGASDAVRGTLARLCSDLNANPSGRADFEADCVYTDQYDALRQHIKDNPYDWLNQLSDFMFNWLNQTSSAIFNDLNTLAGLLGMGTQGFINDNGGIPSGGGASFGSTCPWEEIIDLTATDFGFVGEGPFNGHYLAEWFDTIGWTAFYWDAQANGFENAEYTLCNIIKTLPAADYTGFGFTFTVTCGRTEDGGTGGSLRIGTGHVVDEAPCSAGTNKTWDYNGSMPSEPQISFWYTAGYRTPSTHTEPGGGITITELRIRGTGTNPFV